MMSAPPLAVASAVMTGSAVMTEAIKALYGTAKSINDFINEHIEELKDSDNPTMARTGRVLEAAKFGFGIGFATPVLVIAAGQLLLGNPLAASTVILTSPLNPLALSCAAVGAIYFGWNALSEQEKNEIVEKLGKGMEVGGEMIKSVLGFVISKFKTLMSQENLEEIKSYIRTAAESFGNTLGKITKKVTDIFSDTISAIRKKTTEAVDKTIGKISPTKEMPQEMTGVTSSDEEKPNPVAIKVRLSSKGQLTIPRDLRQQLGLSPNSEVELFIRDENVLVRKVVPEHQSIE